MAVDGIRRQTPLILHQTVEEIVATGQLMRCPEISWGMDSDGRYRVIFHWDHGDRVIYPAVEV